MAATRIKPGMHLVRYRCYGQHQGSVQIPAEIRKTLGMNNGIFMAAVQLGKSILFTPVRNVTPDEFESEVNDAIAAALEAWESREKVSPASAA